jgi:putative endonuclease
MATTPQADSPGPGPQHRNHCNHRNHRSIGADGEDTAARYLVDRGYVLLDRNFFTRRGEIDIVVHAPVDPGDPTSGDEIVFVEVKWRYDARYGAGAEAVTPTKLAAMRYASREWLRRHPEHRAEFIRYDVLDITAGDITHYEGIG